MLYRFMSVLCEKQNSQILNVSTGILQVYILQRVSIFSTIMQMLTLLKNAKWEGSIKSYYWP